MPNKKLLHEYAQIGSLYDGFVLPTSVWDTVKHYYKPVEDVKVYKRKTPDAILASYIFIACRHYGVSRSFQEVFSLTKVSKPEIARIVDLLKMFFEAYDNNNSNNNNNNNNEKTESNPETC